jgi:surface antigen
MNWDILALVPDFSTMDKKSRRRWVRYSLIGGNFLLLALVSVFILTNRSASQTVRSSTVSSINATATSAPNPLDRLSSAQIALTAAQTAGLQELTAVRNQADSDSLILSVIPSDATTVAKPQIVATAQKSKRDIHQYVVAAGDSVASLADKFAVSAESIKWSNNLTGNTLNAGAKLVIPPVNGIVYTVKAGDTPASLAAKYQADASQIISYNDAEIVGLKPGDQIVIPNGRVQVAVYATSYSSYYGFAWGSSAIYGFNGYDPGNCTWYAANKRSAIGKPVPANWGNASTWLQGARAAGVPTDNNPQPGDVIWYAPRYRYDLGHVGFIDQVLPDGTVKESSMNVYGLYSMDYKTYSAEEASHYTYIH